MWNRFLVPLLFLVGAGLAGHALAGCAAPCCISPAESQTAAQAASTAETASPSDAAASPTSPAMPDSVNQLTDAEKENGWMLLFDGQSMDAWRGYRMDAMPDDWTVENGTMHFTGKTDDEADDIVTKETFADFDLRLEWKISEGGNSGIMYHVREEADYPWQTGPEMQVLDDDRHPDAKDPTHRAGALYDMVAPDTTKKQLRPVGEWNEVRLVVEDGRAEHWLNGQKILEYPVEGEAWTEMIADSKFADMPQFGTFSSGRICLQDHNDKVWYRDIKIRRLE
jgi:hypothetical protein